MYLTSDETLRGITTPGQSGLGVMAMKENFLYTRVLEREFNYLM